MNMKTKPILIIIVTLVIGFVIGVLTSAQLRHHRMRSVRVFTSERYFREIIYREVQPTEDQVKLLEPIFERYGKEGRELQRDFRKKFDAHNVKYWEEIKPILTDEQIEIIDNFYRHRMEEMRRFRPDSSRMNDDSRRGRGGPRERGSRGDYEHRGPPA